MKTRHITYLVLILLTLVSSIYSLDYRKKYLDINSQYETLKTQYDKEVQYQQDLKQYGEKIRDSYNSLYKGYSQMYLEVQNLKISKESQKEPERGVSSIETHKSDKKIDTLLSLSKNYQKQIVQLNQKNEKIDKLLSLIEVSKSQIDSLNKKLEEVQNQCSKPVVKIIERQPQRLPASTSQVETKKVKNKPTDKFF